MPHITLEISQNIAVKNPTKLLDKLNQALFATGHFGQISDIKSRIYCPYASLVGDNEQLGFVAITFKLLAGRSTQIKDKLSKTVLEVLQNELGVNNPNIVIHYSIELLDLSDNYQKVVAS